MGRHTGARFIGCKFSANSIEHPNMDGAAVAVDSQAQGAEFEGCTYGSFYFIWKALLDYVSCLFSIVPFSWMALC